jgi:hypothetical protein
VTRRRARDAVVIGAGLALGVCLFATFAGFDRDRAFHPTLTIVIASYYGLFAVMAVATGALSVESAVILLFLFLSVLGLQTESVGCRGGVVWAWSL